MVIYMKKFRCNIAYSSFLSIRLVALLFQVFYAQTVTEAWISSQGTGDQCTVDNPCLTFNKAVSILDHSQPCSIKIVTDVDAESQIQWDFGQSIHIESSDNNKADLRFSEDLDVIDQQKAVFDKDDAGELKFDYIKFSLPSAFKDTCGKKPQALISSSNGKLTISNAIFDTQTFVDIKFKYVIISKSEFTMENTAFDPTNVVSFASNIFDIVDSNKVLLSTVSINKAKVLSGSPIRIFSTLEVATTATLNDCTFDSCTSSVEQKTNLGGIINYESNNTDSKFEITGTGSSFKNCKTDGCGAALAIKFESGGIFTFTTDSVAFENNVAYLGNNLYIDHASLEGCDDALKSISETLTSPSNDFVLCGGNDFAHPIDVYYYKEDRKTVLNNVLVDQATGGDWRFCGVTYYPCASIAIAKEHWDTTGECTFDILQSTVGDQIILNEGESPSKLSLNGVENVFNAITYPETVLADSEGGAILLAKLPFSAKYIFFSLPSKFTGVTKPGYFMNFNSDGELHLSGVVFDMPANEEIDYAVLFAQKGTVVFNEISINGNAEGPCTFAKSPFLFYIDAVTFTQPVSLHVLTNMNINQGSAIEMVDTPAPSNGIRSANDIISIQFELLMQSVSSANSASCLSILSKAQLSVTLSSSSFMMCTSKTYGAVTIETSLGATTLKLNEVIFTECTSNEGKGAALHLTGITGLEMTQCLFQKCTALKGAGIFIERNDAATQSRNFRERNEGDKLEAIIFEENSVTTADQDKGVDVYFVDNRQIPLEADPFTDSFSDADEETRFFLSSNAVHEHKPWIKYGSKSRKVAADGGIDSDFCGISDKAACASINVAFNLAITHYAQEANLFEDKEYKQHIQTIDLTKDCSYAINGIEGTPLTTSIVTEGNKNQETLLKQTCVCQLEINNLVIIHSVDPQNENAVYLLEILNDKAGTHISQCEIHPTAALDQSTRLSHSLFKVQGELGLSDVTINNYRFYKCPLISCKNSYITLEFEESRFNSISVDCEDVPAVLQAVLGNTDKSKLTITNCEFTDCSSLKSTTGGAMHIDSRLRPDSIIKISSSFTRCKAGGRGGAFYLELGDCTDLRIEEKTYTDNEATEAKDFFISSNNLRNVVTESKIDTSLITGSTEKTMGMDIYTQANPIELSFFVTPANKVPTGYVGSLNNEQDSQYCGQKPSYPCKTLSYLLSNILKTEDYNIIYVCSGVSIEPFLEWGKTKTAITSIDGPFNQIIFEESTIAKTEDSGIIECKTDMTFTALNIKIPNSLISGCHSSTLIKSSNNKELVLSSIIFDTSNEINANYQLIHCVNGKVILNDVRLERTVQEGNSKFEKSPIVIEKGVEATIEKLKINGMTINTGSALQIGENEIELVGCEFASVVSKVQASVLVMTGAQSKLRITDCTFESCSNEKEGGKGGALCVEGIDSFVLDVKTAFHTNSFVQSQVKGEKGYGGALYVKGVTSKFEMHMVQFEFCGAVNGNGGGIYIENIPLGSIFNNVMFTGCNGENGGGAYLKLKEKPVKMEFEFSENIGTKGNGVYLYDECGTAFEKDDFKLCSATRTVDKLYYYKTEEDQGEKDWIDYVKDPIDVDPVAGDDAACKTDGEVACKTIHKALSLIGDKPKISLQCKGGDFKEEFTSIEPTAGKQSFVFGSYDEEVTKCFTMFEDEPLEKAFVTVSNGAYFVLAKINFIHDSGKKGNRGTRLFDVEAGGMLFMREMYIKQEAEGDGKGDFTVPMFLMKGGRCEMLTVRIEGFSIYGSSLFGVEAVEKASIEMNGVTAQDITAKCCPNGEAAILTVDMKDHEMELSVSKCTFERCVSETSKKGGAFCIVAENEKARVRFTETNTFRGCKGNSEGQGGAVYVEIIWATMDSGLFGTMVAEGNVAKEGKTVYLKGGNLKHLVTEEHFSKAALSKVGNEMVGTDGVDFGTYAIDLYTFFEKYEDSEMYVSSVSGKDEKYCGSEHYPCQTIEECIRHISKLDAKTIHMKGGEEYEFTAPSVVQALITMVAWNDGEYKEAKVTVGKKGEVEEDGGYFKVTGKLKLSGIEASVPVAFEKMLCGCSPVALFKTIVGGSLAASGGKAVFEAGKTIEYSVLRMEGGSAEFSGFGLEGGETMHFGVSAFVVVEGALTLTGCTYTGMMVDGEYGLIRCGNGENVKTSSVVLDLCKFAKIENSHKDGKGGVVGCEFGSVTVKQTDFVECKATGANGKGGAIYGKECAALSVRSETTTAMVFDSCTASESGGAMHIEMTGDGITANSIGLEYVEIKKCTSKNGGGMYLKTKSAVFGKKFHVVFSENAKQGDGHGIDVYLEEAGAADIGKEDSPFLKSMTTSDADERVYYKGQAEGAQKEFIGEDYRVRYAEDASGEDLENCGRVTQKCKTLKKAVDESTSEGYRWVYGRVVGSGTFANEKETITVAEGLVRVSGPENGKGRIETRNEKKEDAKALIEVKSGGMFLERFVVVHSSEKEGNVESAIVSVADKGTMGIVECELKPEEGYSGEKKFKVSLLNVQGTLECTKVTISGFTLEGAHWLIEKSGAEGGVYLGESTISKITGCHCGSGVAVHVDSLNGAFGAMQTTFKDISSPGSTKGGAVTIESATRVSIEKNSKFENCKCSKEAGEGGGVHIRMQEGIVTIDATTTFGGNEAQTGTNVYLMCNDLRKMVVQERIPKELVSGAEANAIVGVDARGGSIDLKHFYTAFVKGEKVAICEMDGTDAEYCGTDRYPCRSMKFTLESRFVDGVKKTLAIEHGAHVESGVTWNFEKGVKFAGEQAGDGQEPTLYFPEALEVGDENGVFMKNEKILEFESLTIAYGAKYGGECKTFRGSLISGEGAGSALSFVGCKIGHAGSGSVLEFAIVTVKGGSVVMKDVTLDNAGGDESCIFEKSPIVIEKGVGATIEKLNVRKVTINTGSALQIGENEIELAGCKFAFVVSKVQASVLVMTGAQSKLRITDCTFESCSNEKEGGKGGAVCVEGVESVVIGKSGYSVGAIFTNTEVKGEKGCGGALYVKGVTSKFEMHMMQINYCKVVNGNGGGMYVEDVPAGAIFDYIILTTCSGENGGGAYLKLKEKPAKMELMITHCTGTKGNGVYLRKKKLYYYKSEEDQGEKDWIDYVKEPLDVDPVDGDDAACKADGEVACKTIHKALSLIGNKPSTAVKCKAGEFKEELSVFEETSGIGYNIMGADNADGTKLYTMFEEAAPAKGFFVCLNGIGVGLTEICIIHDSGKKGNRGTRLFDVEAGGMLFMMEVHIKQEAEGDGKGDFTVPMFLMKGGRCEMLTVRIEGFSIYGSSLFGVEAVEKASIEMNGVTAQDITAKCCPNGEAAILTVDMKDHEMELSVSKCTFERCVSETSKKGGAFCIVAENEKARVRFTETNTFRGCKGNSEGQGGAVYVEIIWATMDSGLFGTMVAEGNVAKEGKTVYLKGGNLKHLVTEEHFSKAALSKVGNEMVGTDGVDFGTYAIDLYTFFEKYEDSEMYVSSVSGKDEKYCGSEHYPCQTIEECIRHISKLDAKTIHMKGGEEYEFTAPSVVQALITMVAWNDGEYKEAKVTVGKKGEVEEDGGYFKVTGKLKLSGIEASVPVAFEKMLCGCSPVALFKTIVGGSLAASGGKAVFEAGKTIEYSVLRGETMHFGVSAFVVVEGALTLTGCTYTGMMVDGEYGLIRCGNGENVKTSSVVLDLCKFAKIENSHKDGKGGVVGCEFGSVTVKQTDFVECKATGANGKGGAIYGKECAALSVRSETTTAMVFDSCTASESGGAMHIEMTGDGITANSIGLEYVEIKKCTSKNGGGMYLKTKSAVRRDADERVYYKGQAEGAQKEFIGEDYRVRYAEDASGEDLENCGRVTQKCKTLKKAVDESTSEGYRWVYGRVVGSGTFANEKETITVAEGLVRVSGPENGKGRIETRNEKKEDAKALIEVKSGGMFLERFVVVHSSEKEGNVESAIVSVADKGTMGIVECELKPEEGYSGEKKFKVSLLNVQGTLECTKVTISGFTLEGAHWLIEKSGAEGGVYLGESTISKITGCHCGSGVAVHVDSLNGAFGAMQTTFKDISSPGSTKGGAVTIESATRVSIEKNSKFENCKCSKEAGEGGGVHIRMQEGIVTIDATTTFGGNEAQTGTNVYLMCNDLRKMVVQERIPKELVSGAEANAIVGVDARGGSIDLKHFYTAFVKGEKVAICEMDGTDAEYCGTDRYPCRSMKFTLESRFVDGVKKTLAIEHGAHVESGVTWNFEKGVKFAGEQAGDGQEPTLYFPEALEVGDENGVFMKNEKILEFESLTIAYGAKYGGECKTFRGSLISGEGAGSALSFVGCKIGHAGSGSVLEFAIVTVKGGSVVMKDVTLDNAGGDESCIFEKSPIVIEKGVGATIEKLNVRKVTINTGSALQIGENEIELAGCKFAFVVSKVQASVLVMTGAQSKLRITDCTFESCSNEKEGGKGGAVCVEGVESVVIGKSGYSVGAIFTNTEVKGEKGCGGALYVKGVTSKFEMHMMQINYCKVVNGNGGGMYVEDVPAGAIFDYIILTTCSGENGGGAYLKLKEKPAKMELMITHCTGTKGNGVYLYDECGTAFVKDDFKESMVLEKEEKLYYYKSEEDQGEKDWIDYVKEPLDVDPVDGDDAACKADGEVACKTIHKALSLIGNKPSTAVKCKAGEFKEELSVFEETSGIGYNIMGADNADGTKLYTMFEEAAPAKGFFVCLNGIGVGLTEICIIHDSGKKGNRGTRLFDVEAGGMLFMMEVHIKQEAEGDGKGDFTVPMFLMKGGRCEMLTVRIEGFSIYGSSLFGVEAVEKASIEMNGVTAQDITAKCCPNGEAAILTVDMKDHEMELSVSKCTFERCVSETSKKGGAFCIVAENEKARVRFTETNTFRGCKGNSEGQGGAVYVEIIWATMDSGLFGTMVAEGNVAKEGKTVYLKGGNLKHLVTEEHFSKAALSKVGNEMVGTDGVDFGTYAIDLYTFFEKYEDSEMYVSSVSGKDEKYCGSEHYPCQTIEECIRHISKLDAKTIHMKGGEEYEFTAPSVVQALITMVAWNDGEYKEAKVTVGKKGEVEEDGGYFKVTGKLKLSGIEASVPVAFEKMLCGCSPVALFKTIVGGSLAASGGKAVFEAGKTIEYSVLRMEGGSAEFSGFGLEGGETMHFGVSAFVVVEGALTLTGCTYTGMMVDGEYGLIRCGNGENVKTSSVVLDLCKFAKIENSHKDGKGGVVGCEFGSVTVKQTDFVECKATGANGKGGAIYGKECAALSVRSETTTAMVFDSCTASESGGAMHIEMTGDGITANSIGLEYVEIKKCTSKNGGGMYLKTKSAVFGKKFHVVFSENAKQGDGHGIDVYLEEAGAADIGKEDSPFLKSMTTSDADERVYYKGQAEGAQKEFIGEDYRVRYAEDASGEDLENCGRVTQKCKTLKKAVDESTSEGYRWVYGRVVGSGTFANEKETITVAEGLVRVSGPENGKGRIETRNEKKEDAKALIEVKSGGMFLERFVVVHSSEKEGNVESAIVSVADKGTMGIVECELKPEEGGFTLEGAHWLIEKSGAEGGVYLGESTISKITGCHCGSGVAVHVDSLNGAFGAMQTTFKDISSPGSTKGGAVTIESATRVSIEKNSKFENCKCSKEAGEGGGVHIRMQEGIVTIDATTTFGGNEAQTGTNVYLMCNDLRKMVVQERIPKELVSGAEANAIVGSDNFIQKCDLSYFYINYVKSEDGYISDVSGKDDLYCGRVEYPCTTLNYLLHHVALDKNVVYVKDKYIIKTSFIWDEVKTFYLKGKSGTGDSEVLIGTVETSNSHSVIENAGSLTIGNLRIIQSNKFTDGCICNYNALICSEGQTSVLSLDSIDVRVVGTSQHVQFVVIHVVSGSAQLSNIKIQSYDNLHSAEFLNAPILIEANAKIDGNHIDLLSMSSLIIQKESALNIKTNKLIMSRASFSNVRSKAQASILYSSSIEQLELSDCTFMNCINEANNGEGGALYLGKVDSSILISKCQFTAARVSNNGKGGAIYLKKCKSLAINSKTTFSNCVCNGEKSSGGALYVESSPSTMEMNGVIFDANVAELGGAIYFTYDASTKYTNSFTCYFKMQNANTKGYNVYFVDKHTDKLTKDKSPFLKSMSECEQDDRFHYVFGQSDEEKDDYIGNAEISRKAHPTDGNDNEDCGLKQADDCKTIGVAVKRTAGWYPSTIIAADALFNTEAETISIGEKLITITSAKNEGKGEIRTIFEQPHSLFAVNAGSLTLMSFTIKHDSTKKGNLQSSLFTVASGDLNLIKVEISTQEDYDAKQLFSVSLFTMSGGIFSANDATFSKFTFANKPLFSVSNDKDFSIALMKTTISDIERLNGDRAAIIAIDNFDKTMSIRLQGTTFENIKAVKSLRGAAIGIVSPDAHATISFENTAEEEPREVLFKKCISQAEDSFGGAVHMVFGKSSAVKMSINSFEVGAGDDENVAEFGRDLYLQCDSLPNLLIGSSLQNIMSTKTNEMIGKDDEKFQETIDLCQIWGYHGTKVYMGNDGDSSIHCGFSPKYQCSSFDLAISHVSTKEASVILVDEAITAKAMTFNPALQLGVESASKVGKIMSITFDSEITVSQDKIGAYHVMKSVRMKELSFLFPSTFNVKTCCDFSPVSLLAVSGKEGILTIEKCEFSPNTNKGNLAVDYPLVYVDAGRLMMSSTTFKYESTTNFVFTAAPFEVVDSEDKTILADATISLNLNKVTLSKTGLVTSTSKGKITFYGMKATNIESSVGPVLGTVTKGTIVISGCEFSDCSNKAAAASGIVLSAVGDATDKPAVQILSSTFTNLKLTGDQRNGGALFVSKASSFKMDGVTFDKCEASGNGGAAYFEDLPQDTQIKKTKCLNCKAQNGGSFYVKIADALIANVACFFSQSSATKNGIDVYLEDLMEQPITEENNPFVLSLTTDRNKKTLYHKTAKGEKIEENWIAYGESIRVVAVDPKEGDKDAQCGYVSHKKCSTISVAVKNMANTMDCVAQLDSGNYKSEEEIINVDDRYVTVKGKSKASTIITTIFKEDMDGLFTVGAGSLGLNSITIVHDSSVNGNRETALIFVSENQKGSFSAEDCVFKANDGHSSQTAFKVSIISVLSGAISLKNTEFNGFFMKEQPVVTVSEAAASLNMEDTTFNKMTLSGEAACLKCSTAFSVKGGKFTSINAVEAKEGAALALYPQTIAQRISIDGTVFDGCANKEGNDGGRGAAIYIQLKEEVEETPDILINLPVITNCKGWKGKYILFKLSQGIAQFDEAMLFMDLEGMYGKADLICIEDYENKFVDIIGGENGPKVTYRSHTIVLSDAGNEGKQCGTTDKPCSSFGQAINHVITSGEAASLKFKNTFSLTTSYKFETSFTLESTDNAKATIKLAKETASIEKGVFSVDADLTLKNLILQSPNKFTSATPPEAIIVCNSEDKVVIADSFITSPSQPDGTPLRFVHVGGKSSLDITNTELTGTSAKQTTSQWNDLEAEVNIAEERDEAEATICDWTTDKALVTVDGSATATFTNTKFLNGEEGALLIRSDGSVSIKSAVFDSNTPAGKTNYASLRKNIKCEKGHLTIDSMTKENDNKGTAFWIQKDANCVIDGNAVNNVESLLFVPTLTNANKVVATTTSMSNGQATVNFEGTLLMPCGLKWQVARKTGDKFEEWSSYEIFGETETKAKAVVDESVVALNNADEVYVRLTYGQNKATGAILIEKKPEPKPEPEPKPTNKLSKTTIILISVLVPVFAISVAVIVVLVVIIKKKKKRSSYKKIGKMSDSERVQMTKTKEDDGSIYLPILSRKEDQ
ncbi:uncharacterized protein MONOS_9641 [Monocercomonoides exilis]|uniref:uncharacterized protein n=1 Tax=Monocercomonoides exilis TaxID=2049356 RepID=UPI003559B626|nr:hypothetical protein MONOS_9641 [Monocercomonoides exilis]